MITKDIIITYDGNNFSEFIRDLRTYLSLTQKELCDIVEEYDDGKYRGLSYSSLRNYEQNKTLPKYPHDIIDALGEVFREDLDRRGIRILIRIGHRNDI